ncbi:MAG: SPOR domain-containing protein [Paracoccaceae bacterium]
MSSLKSSILTPRVRLISTMTAAAFVLGACSETGGFNLGNTSKPKEGSEEVVARAAPNTASVERDIESPDVFFATEASLWDGRPSLGGVWVSHPDVKEPERVLIRNKNNDKYVVGALFRHERELPGPRLRMSSDAADALGMLAGSPTQVEVVALRKEAVPVEQPVEEPVEAELIEEPAAIETVSLDPIAAAAAAIDATEPAQEAVEEITETTLDSATPSEDALSEDVLPETLPEVTAAAAVIADEPEPAKNGIRKPYLQVGIFSLQENAIRSSDVLRGAGIVPTVREFERDNQTFWRVLAGPAQTLKDRRQLQSALKQQGYGDAYAVTN